MLQHVQISDETRNFERDPEAKGQSEEGRAGHRQRQQRSIRRSLTPPGLGSLRLAKRQSAGAQAPSAPAPSLIQGCDLTQDSKLVFSYSVRRDIPAGRITWRLQDEHGRRVAASMELHLKIKLICDIDKENIST